MKAIIAILLAFLAFGVATNGQESRKKMKYGTTDDKKANALYKEGNGILNSYGNDLKHTQEALDKYLAALERDPKYIDALFAASECYMDLKQPGNQINCIKRAVAIDSTYWVRGYYNCAVALCQKGRFEEAAEWFNLCDKYAKQTNTKIKEDPQWRKSAFAKIEMMSHPVPFEPQYPSDYIRDSPFETYWPSISLDETELVVTSRLPRDTVAFHKDLSLIHI